MLNARTTTISAERLHTLLDALRSDDGELELHSASFDGATFNGTASFGGATFSGAASFDGATFSGDARFVEATFSGAASFVEATFSSDARFNRATFSNARFEGATFSGAAGFDGATFSSYASFNRATFSNASFDGATFSDYASFGGATFSDYASFDRATFSSDASFDRATFSGTASFNRATFSNASFGGATFSSDADFVGATFSGYASFGWATFSGYASFGWATFSSDASFRGATLERARTFGPLSVQARLILDDCVFLERVRLDVAARVVSARASTFAAGILLRVRWAEIALDNADFARPSTVSAATSWDPEHDLPPVCLLDDRHVVLEPRPRLVTLRGAQVAALTVSNVDLRACRFFGAHGLQSLTLEASCEWPRAPSERPRYADRETIAEEHPWREWTNPYTQPAAWLKGRDETDPLTATQLAGLYRALRKAREDDKDQAGAGDLYYGEMEMRRHATAQPAPTRRRRAAGDRVILPLYWLLSGYGLKPARALLALTTLLLIGAALLHCFGFHEPRSYGRSLLFSIESAISLLRPPDAKLSASGETIQITLRLLGPLLLGLALLAVRMRVKR